MIIGHVKYIFNLLRRKLKDNNNKTNKQKQANKKKKKKKQRNKRSSMKTYRLWKFICLMLSLQM